MASYDSDSSGAEDEGYTETNVLLGYASKEAADDTTSQLGGYPTWLDQTTAPNGSLAKCKVCNNLLTLLLQLNGDLPEKFPGHERRLYLFGCRQKTCRRKEGSIRGFRATRASRLAEAERKQQSQPAASATQQTAAPAQQKQAHIGESLFGVKATSGASSASANPFSMGSSSSAMSANPFASASSLAAKSPQPPTAAAADSLPETFASKARISSPEPSLPATAPQAGPPEPWPQQSAFPPAYPAYYLDADYETLEEEELEIPSQARITDMDVDGEEGGSSGGGGASSAKDDLAAESTMDKAFQKFADRLEQNPEQVLRYEFGGHPLLYNKSDTVGKKLSSGGHGAGKVQTAGKSGMPRCSNCGAERVFELQLTPHAISELEAEEMSLEGMEWGTIIMGVCSKDCVERGTGEGEVGYVEEWAGVQWEEQVSKR
ncbi:hypothetical protein MBLNU459_g2025t1 [Dothideomycetes sp. NU459]